MALAGAAPPHVFLFGPEYQRRPTLRCSCLHPSVLAEPQPATPAGEFALFDALQDAVTGVGAGQDLLSCSSGSHIGCEGVQFRQALSRPMPAERDYLEAQFTGVGVLVAHQQAG